MSSPLQTVIETPPYLRDAARFMSESERKANVDLTKAERNALVVAVKRLIDRYGLQDHDQTRL